MAQYQRRNRYPYGYYEQNAEGPQVFFLLLFLKCRQLEPDDDAGNDQNACTP